MAEEEPKKIYNSIFRPKKILLIEKGQQNGSFRTFSGVLKWPKNGKLKTVFWTELPKKVLTLQVSVTGETYVFLGTNYPFLLSLVSF